MKTCSTLFLTLIPLFSLAAEIVPIDSVQQHVNIRLLPDAASEIVGRLHQGDSVQLMDKREGWYEVALDGDASGFISADWTKLKADEQGGGNTEPATTAGELAADVEAVAPIIFDEVVEDVDSAVDAERVAAQESLGNDAAIQDNVPVEPIVPETVDVIGAGIVEAVVDEQSDEPDPPAAETNDILPADVPATPQTVVALKGTRNYLVRFRDENEGRDSQIFDDGNRIGVGTASPKQRLEVNGNIQIHARNSGIAGLMITQASGETGYIMHNRASTLTIGAGSQDRITIDSNGNVGFGVSRPKHPLEMASGAHASAGGVWTNSSSRRYKENIELLSGQTAVSALLALEPVQFNYKNDSNERYVGFIAEDVPDLVATSGRDGLSAMDIVAVLTRVVQQQQQRIEALERRLTED
jgi:hypothetical protein